MSTIKPFAYSYSIQGVKVKPLSEDGKEVSILYNGLLSQGGGSQIFLHCGFGDKNSWRDTSDLPMVRGHEGWEKTIRMQQGNQLNFCFKDGVNNWDNNNGANWAYRISE